MLARGINAGRLILRNAGLCERSPLNRGLRFVSVSLSHIFLYDLPMPSIFLCTFDRGRTGSSLCEKIDKCTLTD